VRFWRVIELWTLPAEEFLTPACWRGAVVPLMRFDGPPGPLLERCREADRTAVALGRASRPLAVSQVLAELRFPGPDLLNLLVENRS